MDLVSELARVVDALDVAGIEFALCGGFAVAIHGHVRATRDIDLLLRRESLEAAVAALRSCGLTLRSGPIPFAPGTREAREIHRVSKVLGGSLVTVDLLIVTPVFEEVWAGRALFAWGERRVSAVSLDGLARMKRLAGRKQDLADLESLGLDPGGES